MSDKGLMSQRIEQRDGGRVLYIALDPEGVWARSGFPHPLVTVDYDAEGCVIGVSAVGSCVVGVLDLYRQWLADGDGDAQKLIADLKRKREVVE